MDVEVEYYNNNLTLPLFSQGQQKPRESKEMALLLMGDNIERSIVCTSVPIFVEHNVEFLIDVSSIGNFEDAKTHGMRRIKTKYFYYNGEYLKERAYENHYDYFIKQENHYSSK